MALAQVIKLKRTLGTVPPASLALGEVALGLNRELIAKRIVMQGGTIYSISGTYARAFPHNIRGKLYPAMLAPGMRGGDHISVAIHFGPGSNGTLESFYIGESATPTLSYNFARPPTRLTFGGLGSIPAIPGTFESDFVRFPYDPAKGLLLSAYLTGGVVIMEAVGYTGALHYTWLNIETTDKSSEVAPSGSWTSWSNRWLMSPYAIVAPYPRRPFLIPADFTLNNKIEAIGAGLHGTNGIRNGGIAGNGGRGGCYARITNFDPAGATEIPFQIGRPNGTIGPGTGPTANTWFGSTLLAAGGDTTTANCIGEISFGGGEGGLGAPVGGGGGGGGAGGPNGAGAAGQPGIAAGAGGIGGTGGGGDGGLGGTAPAAFPGSFGLNGTEFEEAGSGGGGGGGSWAAATNAYSGGRGGLWGAGGGGGGAGNVGNFEGAGYGGATDGALVITYYVERRIKVWAGTPAGVEEVFPLQPTVVDGVSIVGNGTTNPLEVYEIDCGEFE